MNYSYIIDASKNTKCRLHNKELIFADTILDKEDMKKETNEYLSGLYTVSKMIDTADMLISILKDQKITPNTAMASDVLDFFNELDQGEKRLKISKILYQGWFVSGEASHEIYNALAQQHSKIKERINDLSEILKKNELV